MNLCEKCGLRPKARMGTKKKDGSDYYRKLCWNCYDKNRNRREKVGNGNAKGRRRIKEKKPYCEACGFIAVLSCQLDIDHKDGNPKNEAPENKWTLCANCHRLKTRINRDWEKRSSI